MKADISWSGKPATESGLDIAPNPKWSPRLGESTQGRLVYLSMSSGAGRKEPIMENVFACCAGLDIHQKSVEACVRRLEPAGPLHQQTRHWGTMTRDLRAMADWMAAQGVTHVAMESTGVYWKPISNILESRFTGAAGQRAAPETSAGAQERRSGLSMDRAIAATRTAERQLHSA